MYPISLTVAVQVYVFGCASAEKLVNVERKATGSAG